jgi:hypothetical protein
VSFAKATARAVQCGCRPIEPCRKPTVLPSSSHTRPHLQLSYPGLAGADGARIRATGIRTQKLGQTCLIIDLQ